MRRCILCSNLERYRCARCNAPYCSPEHQQVDLTHGHRTRCLPPSALCDVQPAPKTSTRISAQEPRLAAFDEAQCPTAKFLLKDTSWLGSRETLLGKGAYGKVYMYVTGSRRVFAVKEFLTDDADLSQPDVFVNMVCGTYPNNCIYDTNSMREISISRSIRSMSVYIVEIRGVCVMGTAQVPPLLIMRLESGITLSEMFVTLRTTENPKVIDTNQDIKAYFLGTLRALAILHRNGISHMDIKGNNIMISAGHVVLMDFGLAWTPWIRGRRQATRTYNQEYRPPECCLDAAEQADPVVREKGDIWAIACVFLTAVFGRYPLITYSNDKSLLSRLSTTNTGKADARLVDEQMNAFMCYSALMAIGQLDKWPTVFTGARQIPQTTARFSAAKYLMRVQSTTVVQAVNGTVFDLMRSLGISTDFIDLIRGMLDPNPFTRTSAIAAQRSPYFDSVQSRIQVESVREMQNVDAKHDDVRDETWAIALIRRCQLATSACSPACNANQDRNMAICECFQNDHPMIREKTWTVYHRWNAYMHSNDSARGAIIPMSRRYAASRNVVNTLLSPFDPTMDSIVLNIVKDARPDAKKLADAQRAHKIFSAECASHTHICRELHDDMIALLTDLDHDMDRPSPADVILLLMYCSPIRDAIGGIQIGCDVFAFINIVAVVIASLVVRNPQIVLAEHALHVGATCISFGIECAKALHPYINRALNSITLSFPTTKSCRLRISEFIVRDMPNGTAGLIENLTAFLRPTFYSASTYSLENVDMQIANAIQNWTGTLLNMR